MHSGKYSMFEEKQTVCNVCFSSLFRKTEFLGKQTNCVCIPIREILINLFDKIDEIKKEKTKKRNKNCGNKICCKEFCSHFVLLVLLFCILHCVLCSNHI